MASINSIKYPFNGHSELENFQEAEKTYQLVDRIFDFSNCPSETICKIKKIIQDDILISCVGREIISALSTIPKITVIEDQTFKYTVYDDKYHGPRISINLNVIYHYIAQNEKGEKCLQLGSLGQAFVHECVHALHHHVQHKPYGYKHLPKDNLFAEMDNMEEQITICGLTDTGGVQLFCENAFLATQKKPYRINHRAILVPFNESIAISDLASYGVTKHLEEALAHDHSSINVPGKLHASQEGLQGKKLTPLAAAACAGRKDIVEMLLSHGADPLAQDDLGGAFFAAVGQKRFEILGQLFAHSRVDPQCTNPQGQTLFTGFCLATQEFSQNRDPLFWTRVADSFTKLMDPNEPPIQQIIKNKASGHLVQALSKPGDEHVVDQNGNNILMTAIKDGDIRLFKELIDDFTFDLEAKNYRDETPLILALNHSNAEIASEMVSILKEKGTQIPQDLKNRVDALLQPTYWWQL